MTPRVLRHGSPVRGLTLAASVLLSCELHVPDLNNADVDALRRHPSAAAIAAAATGLLIAAREDIALPDGYVSVLGVLGRECYLFDPSDPRAISELLEADRLNRGSRYGSALWAAPYRNIRNVSILLEAIEVAPDLDGPRKAATRGFALTIAAMEYLRIISTRDELGAVIQRSRDPHVLDPLATREEVFAHISNLLDEARGHLMAGGELFPFSLGSGFQGFDTPTSFLRANRALKARLEVYRGDHRAALEALAGSFLEANPLAPNLEAGVHHAYGTGPGDRLNRLNEPALFAHPSILAEAETGPAGTVDARVTRKLRRVEPRTLRMLTSDRAFTVYESVRSPVPIIRNEELILIRAESNIALGNLSAAREDLNFIRVHSGHLPERKDLEADNITDELLRQRFYSLLFEGGHRWIDARRFGRLESLPLDRPDHHRHRAMPIPLAESDGRQ